MMTEYLAYAKSPVHIYVVYYSLPNVSGLTVCGYPRGRYVALVLYMQVYTTECEAPVDRYGVRINGVVWGEGLGHFAYMLIKFMYQLWYSVSMSTERVYLPHLVVVF